MKKIIYLLLFIYSINLFGQQHSLEEKFELPEEVKETSGLIFFNDKVITHNDSGDAPNLYEIDTISGLITRTITISNATHVDWEDISQDDTHIYIADIGNNNGSRQDLTIYKVLKSDYTASNSIIAEVITFSYEDQTDFTSLPNNNNFDAEAISVYQNSIFIFTKNWIDFKTNAYKIPTTIGNHVATKVSSYDSLGLITGSSYNPADDSFLLCGYDNTFTPFLIYVSPNRPSGDDIFSGGNHSRIEFTGDIFLEQGSQVEAITVFDNSRYYISREFFSTTIGGTPIEFKQKLYEFSNDFFFLLSTEHITLKNSISLFPNPIDDHLTIQLKSSLNVKSIELYDLNGKNIQSVKNSEEIEWKSLTKGIYFLKIQLDNKTSILKKVIKE